MPADVMIPRGDMDTRLAQARLPASLATSAALHALGLLLAVRFLGTLAMPNELPRAEIIPVSLVSLPGGGGGPRGDGSPAPPPAAATTPAPPAAAPVPAPKVVKHAPQKRIPSPAPPMAPATRPEPAPPVVATPGPADSAGAGGGSGAARGTGSGDGSGGDGSGGARPAYGSNPRPPYPLAARRLRLEGRVLLDVVVRPDGRAASVAVRQSSGHAMLDASAADTVRERWRFVPARRNGVAVESTVTVPIRFRIDES